MNADNSTLCLTLVMNKDAEAQVIVKFCLLLFY